MRTIVLIAAVLVACLSGMAADWKNPDLAAAAKGLPPSLQKLLPLHKPLTEPQPGDWLAEQHEAGQTYAQYIAAGPTRVDARRKVIYIQPLGKFDATERKILDETAAGMGVYFQLPVKIRDDLPLSIIPAKAQRERRDLGRAQILTTYVMDEVLRPRLPRDACVYLALTATDLWPGQGWNYVFGQASLEQRVGVWSFCRNGDPHGGEAAYRTCLRRTLKVATHETGHMFSLQHCIYYECNMCGSNSLPEADRQPMWLCPICLGKLCHATGADPLKRFDALASFYKEHGMKEEQAFFEKSADKLGK